MLVSLVDVNMHVEQQVNGLAHAAFNTGSVLTHRLISWRQPEGIAPKAANVAPYSSGWAADVLLCCLCCRTAAGAGAGGLDNGGDRGADVG
jgi:hypothetical protein